MIPAEDVFCADPYDPREPDPRPHTYGVRVCSCDAFATEPCRPTACIPAAPFHHTHCHLRPRPTTVWRNLQQHPRCADAITTLHSPFFILNWSHTFSAKERDAETGLPYFGSRYYSSDLSIWLIVDPMSGKYPSLSPYVYCANNPLILIDPIGNDLELCGEEKDLKTTINMMNDFINSDNPIFDLCDGKVSVRELNKDEYDNLSSEQQSFYSLISSVVNDDHTVSVDIVNNSNEVFVGSYELGQIDIGDIMAIGEGEAMNCYSTFGHEIAEQYKKQTSGTNHSYSISHFGYGLKYEDLISGYTRGSSSTLGNLFIVPFSSSEKGNARVVVSKRNNNVESVTRYNF